MLVGANEGYYGECNFQIEPNTPQYVKLDRSLLKGLFGKFNPSRGDLVFSRTGELLGIMVNDTYCLTIRNFAAAATFPFDQDLQQPVTRAGRCRDFTARFPTAAAVAVSGINATGFEWQSCVQCGNEDKMSALSRRVFYSYPDEIR